MKSGRRPGGRLARYAPSMRADFLANNHFTCGFLLWYPFWRLVPQNFLSNFSSSLDAHDSSPAPPVPAHGFSTTTNTSVRTVVAKARVNQAATNYHFGGKDGLYREVLRTAIRAPTEHQLAHAEEMKRMSPENALAEFIKHQLRQLASRDEISRHYRIFDWEAVRPTAVYRKLITEEATPFLSFAVDLVRRSCQMRTRAH
jgi:hypothetical protein